MRIKIVNEFHNVNKIITIRGEVTYEKFKKHSKDICSQKDCKCLTEIYSEQKMGAQWKSINEEDLIAKANRKLKNLS
jgi:hypothetical protein